MRLFSRILILVNGYPRSTLELVNRITNNDSVSNDGSPIKTMTRESYAENYESIDAEVIYKGCYSKSGGTSGDTIKIHTDVVKKFFVWVVIWFLRFRFKLYPWTKGCSLWGHGHLIEEKRSGQRKKTFNFNMSRIRRFSTYDLSDENLRNLVVYFLRPDVEFLICYGGVLPLVYQAILREHSRSLIKRNKIIISTSEPCCPSAVRKLSLLGVDVIQEYGMAEVGVIGYSSKNSMSVEYLNPLLKLYLDNERQLLITTVGRWMPFPLKNYETGDFVDAEAKELVFKKGLILGKKRLICELTDGAGVKVRFSIVTLDHFLKTFDTVRSVSFFIVKGAKILINICATRGTPLPSPSGIAEFLNNELSVKFAPNQFEVVLTSEAQTTVAGKGYVLT